MNKFNNLTNKGLINLISRTSSVTDADWYNEIWLEMMARMIPWEVGE